METKSTRRVAAGCGTAVAVLGQMLAGLFYLATYTPEPIGNDGGFSGRSEGMPHSGPVHAVIIVSGVIGIIATIAAGAMGSNGRRWPCIAGLGSSAIGFVAAIKMSRDLEESGGGLAVLGLGLSLNILIGVALASAFGFIAGWPRRDVQPPPADQPG